MYISNIKESGANNIISWALSNQADIFNDDQLKSLINDELFYLVTLKDINFFELYRLVQTYRDKVRILNESMANIPSDEELNLLFPGIYSDGDQEIPLIDLVKNTIMSFINIIDQMKVDDDIIHSSTVRLFLPMITRKFDVQIPISFIDFINSMNDQEASEIFTEDYPNTIQKILDSDLHGVKNTISAAFVKWTSLIKYNKRYDQCLKLMKYAPIKKDDSDKLYRFGLSGFYKKDPISRGIIYCSLFKSNSDNMLKDIKRIGSINSPLRVSFAVQLPIQYSQILQNAFSPDILNIEYQSSILTILDDGIRYEDFKLPAYNTSEDEEQLQEFNNQIEAYRVRIAESNETLLKTISILLDIDDVDKAGIFSLLPSLYTSKAIITLNMEHLDKYTGFNDSVISEMFTDMISVSNKLIDDINTAKR